jgi:hypothetical protein
VLPLLPGESLLWPGAFALFPREPPENLSPALPTALPLPGLLGTPALAGAPPDCVAGSGELETELLGSELFEPGLFGSGLFGSGLLRSGLFRFSVGCRGLKRARKMFLGCCSGTRSGASLAFFTVHPDPRCLNCLFRFDSFTSSGKSDFDRFLSASEFSRSCFTPRRPIRT